MPEVIIVHTIDLPVDLVGTRPVERAEAAHVIAAKARCNGDQLREIPTVQRNVLHDIVGNGHGLGLRGGVERQSRCGHFYGGSLLLQRKFNLQRVDASRGDFHFVNRVDREAGGRDRNFIEAERDILESKSSIIGRCGRVIDARRGLRCLHRSIRNHRSRRIRHSSVNRATKRLRVYPHCEQQNDKNC